jgi:hypothetical protein
MVSIWAALALAATSPVVREERAGWVRLTLSGSPREIGRQYGTLAAEEIAQAHAALRPFLRQNTGKEWAWFREEARRMFWPKVPAEYREEMEGQAEGLAEKGKSIDVWDVLAFNGYIELEGYYLPWLRNQSSQKTACSALIATGSYTEGGGIVMAHNLWWDYMMGPHFNLILDIRPEKGYRIVMDALAGFFHSGSDFAVTSAGLLVTETTISGAKGFDPEGTPAFVRMREATQYADNLVDWAARMRRGNNGGYANTWLVGDTKTGEIGQLELGFKHVTWKTTKDGYFAGANFPENPEMIREDIPEWDPDPKTNDCERRRLRWQQVVEQNKGKITAELAREFLADTVDAITGQKRISGGTLCGFSPYHGAVNAKTIDTALAKDLSFWARMGFPDGVTRRTAFQGRPNGRAIPPQPWTKF